MSYVVVASYRDFDDFDLGIRACSDLDPEGFPWEDSVLCQIFDYKLGFEQAVGICESKFEQWVQHKKNHKSGGYSDDMLTKISKEVEASLGFELALLCSWNLGSITLQQIYDPYRKARVLDTIAADAYLLSQSKGWWEEDYGTHTDNTKINMITQELGEWTEALRQGNPPSKKISATLAEEEVADVIIRAMDWTAARKFSIGCAVVNKHTFNTRRPYMHGGKLF